MIGNKLKELRISNGYTQVYVSNALSITVDAYGTYERNIRDVSTDILIKICKFYDVSADWILDIEKKGSVLTPAQSELFARDMLVSFLGIPDDKKVALVSWLVDTVAKNHSIVKDLTDEQKKFVNNIKFPK